MQLTPIHSSSRHTGELLALGVIIAGLAISLGSYGDCPTTLSKNDQHHFIFAQAGSYIFTAASGQQQIPRDSDLVFIFAVGGGGGGGGGDNPSEPTAGILQ